MVARGEIVDLKTAYGLTLRREPSRPRSDLQQPERS